MTVLVRLGAVESRRFGFELVKPSSVDITGGGSETATVSALGSVEFSACATLSLNGVFSSGYDNYMVVAWMLSSNNGPNIRFRLRTSGSDASAANDYVYQNLYADNTTVAGSRETTDTFALFGNIDDGQRSGNTAYIYGPGLAQPTAGRNVNVSGFSDAYLSDSAWTHDLSTAYDGFTIFPPSGTFAGRVAVYGMRG